MTHTRITSASDPAFLQAMQIFLESFPYQERWDQETVATFLQDSRYHFLTFFQDTAPQRLVGFFTYWDFGGGYIYAEHFAVNPQLRGAGSGKAILEHIQSLGHTVLLEIEPPAAEDLFTVRRKAFYDRNGFILNPWDHVQPAYHKDSSPVALKIMSWPHSVRRQTYEHFRSHQALLATSVTG